MTIEQADLSPFARSASSPLRRPPRRSLRTTPPIHWPTCHRCCQCRLLLRSSASAARRPIGTQRVEPCLSGISADAYSW